MDVQRGCVGSTEMRMGYATHALQQDMECDIQLQYNEAKGIAMTPSRSELLNQWARSGSPTSLPSASQITPCASLATDRTLPLAWLQSFDQQVVHCGREPDREYP